MSFLISVFAFLLAIGVLVAVHEYGHFWVARKLGFKVERFSIGFGRPLLKWYGRDADRTEYWLSAVPLGGYVKMLDEREGPIAPEDQGRAFTHRPVPARIAVLLAGAGANFAFAVVAFWLMFMIGVPGVTPVVGPVAAESPAQRAGLRDNEQILEVGGVRTPTWESAVLAMLDDMLGDGVIRLTVAADAQAPSRVVEIDVSGRESQLTEPGALLTGLGIAPWSPDVPAVLGDISPGGSAQRADLREGDEIIAADGQSIGSWSDWVEFVRARPDSRVEVEYLRDERPGSVVLEIDSVIEDGQVIGRIGAGVNLDRARGLAEHLRAEQRFGPVAALGQGAVRTWDMTGLTLRMLGRMVTGDVSVKNISGPISIGQYAGFSLVLGASAFLNFLAIVSISLGILNLLPIPMLDGGQIVYQLVEWVKGSPLSDRTLLICQQLGLGALLVIMSFAFYNDIMRLMG
ncbi:MAG: RIP metalloprotease RseP [Gammaproteobacteria bacterium]|nr:RIP metalloprotease RseP [Gammaproteobacteria bacterium]